MRIKLDENLPLPLTDVLQALGHDVEHVRTEGLTGRPDADVWSVAQEERRFLITQDVRFVDRRMFIPGQHFGLMLLRLENPSIRTLTAKLQATFSAEAVEKWSGCLIVVSDRKVRVRCG